jgi:tetratricopeptide (TPR) repeat protein
MDPDTDTVMVKYNIAFDETGKPTFSYFRERIVRRGPFALWQGAIHEVIAPFGKILHLDAAVTHKRKGQADPKRNLNMFERMLERGTVFSPREQFYYARELFYNARFEDGANMFQKFLDDGLGWVENNIEACRMQAQCLQKLERTEDALRALIRSFEYDAPRAEICCELGAYYFSKSLFAKAALWYKTALLCPRDETGGGFVLIDCYGYLPLMQLCVCYDHMGLYAEAEAVNEAAGKIRPQSAAYLYNKNYFDTRNNPAPAAE